MGSGKIKNLNSRGKNLFFNLLTNNLCKLSYVIESSLWSIKQDGENITGNLNKLGLIKSRITTTYLGLRNQIIHFGSVHTFLRENGFRKPYSSNKLVLTWFHFVPEDKKNKNIIEAQKCLNFIHTSSSITKNNLVNLGVDPEKIVVIPLGVDLSLFKPVLTSEKQKLKEKFNIPENKIVIGSFQKDGVGWEEGLEPKMVKGPDIFVEAVEELAKNYPIFVLLVGPARGYVESNLKKRNIPYLNIGYLKSFKEVPKYYRVLDLYLITSRIEGGPKQILESWASGIPVVSTKVGMVPDITKDKENVLLAEIEDINQIVEKAEQIIKDKNLREKLIENGLKTVQNYSWKKISQKYYNEIYSEIGRSV